MNNQQQIFDPYKFTRSPTEESEDEVEIPRDQQKENIPQMEAGIDKKPFDPMEFSRPKEESWTAWAARQGVRGAARVGEGFFGAPGNIKKFLKDLIISSYENSTFEGDWDPQNIGKRPEKQREAPDWLKYTLEEAGKGIVDIDVPTTQ